MEPVSGSTFSTLYVDPSQEAPNGSERLYEETLVPGTSFTARFTPDDATFFTLEIKNDERLVGKARVGLSTRFDLVLVEIEHLCYVSEEESFAILEVIFQAAVELAVAKGVDIRAWLGRGCWVDVLGDAYVSTFKKFGLHEVSYAPAEQEEFPRGRQGVVFSNTGGELCFHLPCDRSAALLERVSKQPIYRPSVES